MMHASARNQEVATVRNIGTNAARTIHRSTDRLPATYSRTVKMMKKIFALLFAFAASAQAFAPVVNTGECGGVGLAVVADQGHRFD